MSQMLELLKMMRGKIATGWTQGCSARSMSGFPVVSYSDDASQWCLIGSMTADRQKLGWYKERSSVASLLRDLIANRNEKPVIEYYNDADGRTKEDVLELLDEAIQVASAGGHP